MLFSLFQPKKSVFSGFSGFNKAQPASFDFLSKLTNGNSDSNSSNKADSSVTSSLFTSKPLASPSSGIFGNQSTTTPTKSPFGSPSTQTGSSSLFGAPAQNASTPSMFMTSKADSTVKDSPFKIQNVTSSTDNNTESTKSSIAPVTSSKFDIPSTSANVAKSLFSTTSNSTPFKIQPMSNTSTAQNTFVMASKPEAGLSDTDKKPEDTKNDKKMKYYSKLKGLNESVSDWIKKHVEQTPLCILSPIFKDYEKYLKEIQDEYGADKQEVDKNLKDKFMTGESKTQLANVEKPTTVNNTTGSSIFNASSSPKSLFASQSNTTAATEKTEKSGSFSYGIGSSTNTSSTITTSSAGFSFGAITSSTASAVTSSPYSFATTTSTTAANGTAAPFSFGIGKPFSFNSNVKQNTDTAEETNEDEDSPPKVEFTPFVEDNNVYDKRCKVFVKKDGNFVDKGVGTLYIKKVEESGKHQLLVRANTNLGTILVNLILVSAIPTQRMGKNNVMLVCIPTPESKPPPTPILIRVKTSEEADELLETLNKYKA